MEKYRDIGTPADHLRIVPIIIYSVPLCVEDTVLTAFSTRTIKKWKPRPTRPRKNSFKKATLGGIYADRDMIDRYIKYMNQYKDVSFPEDSYVGIWATMYFHEGRKKVFRQVTPNEYAGVITDIIYKYLPVNSIISEFYSEFSVAEKEIDEKVIIKVYRVPA